MSPPNIVYPMVNAAPIASARSTGMSPVSAMTWPNARTCAAAQRMDVGISSSAASRSTPVPKRVR
jgi:hypothetical protein